MRKLWCDIENADYVRDQSVTSGCNIILRVDREVYGKDGLPDVWIALSNAALSVLRLVQAPGDPPTATAENFHYSPRKALQILGFSGN